VKAFRQRAVVSFVVLILVTFLTVTPPQRAEPLAGQLDQTFGAGGIARTSKGGYSEVYNGVAVQPDGKIIAAGPRGFSSGFALARYNPDGSLDSGFGSGGFLVEGFHGLPSPGLNAIKIQPDGKLLVGGYADEWLYQPCAMARFNADGTPDASFGDHGKLITIFKFDHFSPIKDIALQSDGRIIAAGAIRFQTDYGPIGPFDAVLARYSADGQLDQSFAGGGAIWDFFGKDDVAERVLVQPDDKIIVAGTFTDDTQRVFVERRNADGTPDPSFGDDGEVRSPFKERKAQGVAVARQADGKLLLAASVSMSSPQASTTQIALARLNANGSLDASFGNGGVAVAEVGSNRVGALLVQPDGKAVVVVNSRIPGQLSSLLLLRFNVDGSRDTEFQSSAVVAEGAEKTEGNAVAMQSDGKIVVAGGADRDFLLARFESGVVIPPAPDFAIEAVTPVVAGTAGEKVQVTISVKRIGSFAGPVTITAPDTGSPKIVVNQSEAVTETGATFAFKIKSKAPKGDHALVFKAKDATGRERAVTVTLTVH
jgi:uncharacterized delta-60 repeat protein